MNSVTVDPDAWIVCSERAWNALEHAWLPTFDARSHFALRWRCGGFRRDTLAGAREWMLRQPQVAGTVHLVVEVAEECGSLDSLLHHEELGRHEVVRHVWRDAPLDAVAVACAPDTDYLAAWRRMRRRPQTVDFGPEVHPQLTAASYLLAVEHWERQARSAEPEAMEELYGAAAAPPAADEDLRIGLTAGGAPTGSGLQRNWLSDDGTSALEVKLLDESSGVRVRIQVDCSPETARQWRAFRLELDSGTRIALQQPDETLDWSGSAGKAITNVHLALDDEAMAQLTHGVRATLSARRRD